MKIRVFALLTVLLLCFGAFVSCQSGDPPAKEPVVFDAGSFSAKIPDGWKAFAVKDMFSEEPDALNPNQLQICKGGETEFDLFSKPYIQFDCYAPDYTMMRPSKDLYDNGQDLEPIVAGDYTWEGFTGESGDNKLALLFLELEDGHSFQATVWYDVNGTAFSLSDADVLEILSSVTLTGAAQ